MIDIRLDDDQEKLLKLLMEHDKERTATAMVRALIRDGLRARGLWPLPQSNGSAHAQSEQFPA